MTVMVDHSYVLCRLYAKSNMPETGNQGPRFRLTSSYCIAGSVVGVIPECSL